MRRKQIYIICAGIALSILVICVIGIVHKITDQKNTDLILKKMPYIVFYSNSSRTDGVYFCSNGDMYLGYSEDAFEMPWEEIAKKIQNNEYDGLLKFLGNCGSEETRQKYLLFYEVCVNDSYHMERNSHEEPKGKAYGQNSGQEYDARHRYWIGVTLDDNGKMKLHEFYISAEKRECSDERAYEIVQWMYDCLVRYADY